MKISRRGQTSTSLSISLVWVTILRFYETKEHFRERTTQDDKLYKHTRHNSALDDHKKLPYESHLCKTSLWLLFWACCTGGSRLVVQTLVQTLVVLSKHYFCNVPISKITHVSNKSHLKTYKNKDLTTYPVLQYFTSHMVHRKLIMNIWNGQCIMCNAGNMI